MKHFKIYATFLVLVISFNLNSCSSDNLSPGDTIKKTYDLIKNKDFKKTTSMYVTRKGEKLTGEDAEKMTGLVEMAYAQFEEKEGIKNVEIRKETISDDGQSAQVEFTVNYKNGETDKQKAELLNIDGKWFIKL